MIEGQGRKTNKRVPAVCLKCSNYDQIPTKYICFLPQLYLFDHLFAKDIYTIYIYIDKLKQISDACITVLKVDANLHTCPSTGFYESKKLI